MKSSIFNTGKYIAICIMVLYSTTSFCQYTPATIYQTPKSSNYYPHDHDSAITVMPKLIKSNFLYYGFLSSLNQHISFEYDRQMNDDLMITAQAGIISTGLSGSNNSTPNSFNTITTTSGGYFEGGVKLFLNPDYTRDGRHGYYTVEGLYIKPQIVVSIFNTTVTTNSSYYQYPPSTSTELYSYTGGAILINLGGQWMIAHLLSIDLYGGIGISYSNQYSSSEPFTSNYYSFLTAGQNFPLAVTGGINIGLPF